MNEPSRKVWVVETWHHAFKAWVPWSTDTNRERAWCAADDSRNRFPKEKFRTVAYVRKVS
jgi:hypothetical protein